MSGRAAPRDPLRPPPALTEARVACGRPVLRSLPGGKSLLLSDQGADTAEPAPPRLLVAKPLPRDCLVQGELHAHVRARLTRVRELAELRVGRLHGVEEDPELGPMLLWGWVEGEDLPAAAARGLIGSELGSVTDIARRLVSCVEKLHLLGIVHGALHLRNVIVSPQGELVLTHISPLVVDDVSRDAAAVVQMLRGLNSSPALPPGTASVSRPGGVATARPDGAVLARVIAECGDRPDLAALRERLLLAGGARFVTGVVPDRTRASRHRSFLAAVVLGVVGLAVALLAVWRFG